MIAVQPSTRDRLAKLLEQMQLQERRQKGRKHWTWWRSKLTMDSALVLLLDRHEAHQARNKKHAAAVRAKRRGIAAQAGPFVAEAMAADAQAEATNGEGVPNGEA